MKDLKEALKDMSKRILAGIPSGQANDSFLGPSLYFSQEALKACQKDFQGERHIEMVYATLASWGMHRTGIGGAKMPEYNVFRDSILRNRETLEALRYKRIEELSNSELGKVIQQIEELCFSDYGIQATTTGSKLVSSSKTLAHILPDLVPPIDREYTVTYFYGNKNLSDKRSRDLLHIMLKLVHEVFQQKVFPSKAQTYQQTCGIIVPLPKIIDNVIIDIVGATKIP